MRKFILVVGIAAISSACVQNESTKHPVINNDLSELANRVTQSTEAVLIDAPHVYSKVATGEPVGLTLTLIASVSPPVYLGVTLQANEVRIKGSKAYVSYNVKGEAFLGGVDVFDITNPKIPVLVSSMVLPGTDVNGLAVRGDDLYMASASDDFELATPAVLKIVRLQGGLLTDSITQHALPSFAATSVDVIGDNLFVTSGAVGGAVNVLNTSSLSMIYEHKVDDARSVDSDGQNVVVLAGSSKANGDTARLNLYDRVLGDLRESLAVGGATIPFSKSTVELKAGKAVLALNDGGTKVICLSNGNVIAEIEPPVIAGIDSSLTVTNSASAFKNALFMASGEAGVYVALADNNFANQGCNVDNLRVVGKLSLGDLQSANHVAYRNNVLFVAGGVGGLKVIAVDLANDFVDNDDSE